jgi:diguanylate cyclase (GGDEF)-like protein
LSLSVVIPAFVAAEVLSRQVPMDENILFEQPHAPDPKSRGRRRLLAMVGMGCWALIIVVQVGVTAAKPTLGNSIILLALALLFAAVHAQLLLLNWAGHRRWRNVTMKLMGSTYISDVEGLPNRNYLLSELRREMPRARTNGKPFTIVVLSLDSIEAVARRRGHDFAERAIRATADTVRRITRRTDFVSDLGGGRFCVLLADCTIAESTSYLQRVPPAIAVSDGRHVFDVPLSIRVREYDMEAGYATDVLREAEEAVPLRHARNEQHWSQVA